MAFPLQSFTSSDAVIKSCGDMKYLVYCNSILPTTERLASTQQYITFAIALASVAIPILYILIETAITQWKKERGRRKEEALRRKGATTDDVETKWNSEALASICTELDDFDIRSMTSLLPGTTGDLPTRSSMLGSLKAWSANRLSTNSSARSSFELPSQVKLPESPNNYRSSVRSFILHRDEDPTLETTSQQDFDLRIVHLLSKDGNKKISPGSSRRGSTTPSLSGRIGSTKHTMGLVDVDRLHLDEPDDIIEEIADSLNFLRVHRDCKGLVIKTSDASDYTEVTKLLRVLHNQGVSCFIMADADAKILRTIDFFLLDGLVVQNAAILPNGERRGFFKAKIFRDVMANCFEKRKTEPGFFIGFIDLWNYAPSAAVARRAFKLAEYYGATVFHGPKQKSQFGQKTTYSMSLSAFDYLKREEAVRTQRSWMKSEKKVDLNGDEPEENVSRLPLEDLTTIIPQVEELLRPRELPSDLQKVHMEVSQFAPPPANFNMIPQREDFWTISSDFDEMSDLGAFPLGATVTPKQYHSLAGVQRHLRTNNMLEEYLQADTNKLASQLQNLLRISKHPTVLQDLIQGLVNGDIQVFKGLATGFKCPDSEAVLYGLSTSSLGSEDMCIYISRGCPDDAGTVLHVYYACYGISRMERYEEELRLNQATSPENAEILLPNSIRAEISEATASELLYLVQQTSLSKTAHPIFEQIQKQCSMVLTELTTQRAWGQIHSKGFLEGSTPMRSLLQMRLEYFASRGVRQLPSMNGLLQLSAQIENAVNSSLLIADRSTLDLIFNALLKTYDPWGSWKKSAFVDVNADLFALIFFCILRKAAFEDLFIETTDRCPFFLTQPDQAAVFSELWVLGSQCEIYFGVLPRTIGEIIYARYRHFLTTEPPEVSAWDGKNAFTAYSYGTLDKSDPFGEPAEQKSSRTLMDKLQDFGALSIFCVPALIDILLLTFFGRGLFVTAFMHPNDRMVATFGILGSLLLSSGVTGWSASVGGYYLFNHAFHNMNYFLIQRISAGLVLTLMVSLCGLLAFSLRMSPSVAAVFVAYLVMISTYLNILGIQNSIPYRCFDNSLRADR